MGFRDRRLRAAVVWAGRLAFVVVLGLTATILALAVTPKVSVSAFGQTVQVGAVPPGPGLGLSGPGRADLFGEGAVDTVQQFGGPIRPLIVWQQFNRNDEAGQFLQSSSADGRRTATTGSREVGDLLAEGWKNYFERLLALAALLGAALYLLGVGAAALFGRARPQPDRKLRLAGVSDDLAFVGLII
jgi:hypothetical protein